MEKTLIIEALLHSDEEFVRKCILLLYHKQEDDEQAIRESVHQNGVGFNKADAFIMTALAVKLEKTGELNITDDIRKRMKKYARQLSNYLTDEEVGL